MTRLPLPGSKLGPQRERDERWFVPAERMPQESWNNPESMIGRVVTLERRLWKVVKYRLGPNGFEVRAHSGGDPAGEENQEAWTT